MEDRDYKQRTPLQVAAELGMVSCWIKTGKFLNMSAIFLSCYCCNTYNHLSILNSFIISPEVLIRTKPIREVQCINTIKTPWIDISKHHIFNMFSYCNSSQ